MLLTQIYPSFITYTNAIWIISGQACKCMWLSALSHYNFLHHFLLSTNDANNIKKITYHMIYMLTSNQIKTKNVVSGGDETFCFRIYIY